MNSLNLRPPTVSTYAVQVDYLFWVMVAVCGSVAIGIAIFVVFCAVKYRRKRPDELPPQISNNYKVETAWTLIPLFIFLGMFGWGAKLYFYAEQPPAHTLNIFVVGKQWMWTIEHPNGIREINTLHIPIDTPVRLTLISQDVVHSFFVPAFRTKQDVLPDRYTTEWFEATSAGKYHLFCSEYCGAKHAGMIGWVYAMNPHDYQLWLQQGAGEGSLASQGEKIFHEFGCANCHRSSGHGPGPNLRGLYGTQVQLTNGKVETANAAYIRECILRTRGGLVFGFANIMPNFKGQLNELQILALVSYIKAIGPESEVNQPSAPGTALTRQGYQPGIAGPGSSSIAGTKPDSR